MTNIPTKWTLGLALLLIAVAAQATLYRWTDEQGNVHMSDKPPPANVEYEVMDQPRPNVVTTPKPPPPPQDVVDTLGEPAEDEAAPKAVVYRSLRIIQPQEDEGVRANNGEISITVSPNPGLGEDDKIVIYLDNKVVSRGKKTSVTIQNVNRGTHKTRAVIINRKGRTVIKSRTVTFHVLRFVGGG